MTLAKSCASEPQVKTALQKRHEWPILLVLSGVQFAHVLDFVILMPLAPQLMRMLDITPQEFAYQVSAYTFSAALAGLVGATVIDRFDRKRALIWIFCGFLLGTLGCGLAVGFKTLLIGRIVTGAFGGIIQALVFAILGDSIAEQRRGRAMGTVMSAFSFASIAGVPLGLFLATEYDWRMPFFALSALSFVILLSMTKALPPLQSHFQSRKVRTTEKSGHLIATLRLIGERNTRIAFGLIASLMFGGFTVIPFMSAYLVANVGLEERDLATVFFIGGLATFLTQRLVGRIADRFGKRRVFTVLALLSILPTLLLTHLPTVSLSVAITVTTLFTVLVSARAVPSLAMITSSIERSRRGSFLSLTSAVQQASSGAASLSAGAIIGLGAAGQITSYDGVGYLASLSLLFAVAFAHLLRLKG